MVSRHFITTNRAATRPGYPPRKRPAALPTAGVRISQTGQHGRSWFGKRIALIALGHLRRQHLGPSRQRVASSTGNERTLGSAVELTCNLYSGHDTTKPARPRSAGRRCHTGALPPLHRSRLVPAASPFNPILNRGRVASSCISLLRRFQPAGEMCRVTCRLPSSLYIAGICSACSPPANSSKLQGTKDRVLRLASPRCCTPHSTAIRDAQCAPHNRRRDSSAPSNHACRVALRRHRSYGAAGGGAA